MNESATWKSLRKKIRSLDPVRIENSVERGTPDVNHVNGWVELKYAERWPQRGGPLRLKHCTPYQMAWLYKRIRAGGVAGVMLRVGQEWYYLNSIDAITALYQHEMNRESAQHLCSGYWKTTKDMTPEDVCWTISQPSSL